MTSTPAGAGLVAARRGISVAFVMHAVVGATWASRLPALKRHAGLGDGQLGLTLFGLAAGMIVGTRLAGAPIDRYGSRPLTRWGMPVMCVTLIPLALAVGPASLAAGFFLFGTVAGFLDVAINAQGVAVENVMPRPILSSLHGLWAVGLGVGAALGALFAAAGVPAFVHFTVVAGVVAALSVPALSGLLPAAPSTSATAAGEPESHVELWSAVVLLLGAIAFCSYFLEGSMGDWSAVYLRDSLDTSAGVAASGFAAFSAAMAVSRFTADRLVVVYGPVRLVRTGCIVAAIGLSGALLVDSPAAVIAGFAVVGAGLGPIVPVTYRAAGRIGGGSSGRVLGRVVTFAYVGTVVGPLMIGGMAELTTLRTALCLPVALALCAAALGERVSSAL